MAALTVRDLMEWTIDEYKNIFQFRKYFNNHQALISYLLQQSTVGNVTVHTFADFENVFDKLCEEVIENIKTYSVIYTRQDVLNVIGIFQNTNKNVLLSHVERLSKTLV